jgi:HK97 family phage portal protein
MANWLTALIGGPIDRKNSGGSWTDRAWEVLVGGITSKSGASINHVTALRVAVVLACCRVLAEGVAQLPLKLYQENDDGTKKLAKGHPVYKLLWRRPNDWMTSFEFRETMMYHAILCRGGFAIKTRVRGVVNELIPVMPDRVTVITDGRMNTVFHVALPDGEILEFKRDDMFHVRGPSWDGRQGMEAIDLARDAIGLAISTEETHAKFHKNGARTSGIIGMDGALSDQARATLKKAFEEATTGDNAFRAIVLDQGAKFHQMSMTGVDGQHLETRKFQVEEVCRAMRVFPQMVGYSDKTSTYASAEQFFIAHVIHSLGPWIERWEQALDRDLLTDSEIDQGFFSKFSVQGLLRGDAKARAEFYASGITNGWLQRNEARRWEDLDPVDGLDTLLMPLNMAEVGADGHAVVQSDGQPGAMAYRRPLAAGRVLSARNEKRIRDAGGLLDECLAELGDEVDKDVQTHS